MLVVFRAVRMVLRLGRWLLGWGDWMGSKTGSGEVCWLFSSSEGVWDCVVDDDDFGSSGGCWGGAGMSSSCLKGRLVRGRPRSRSWSSILVSRSDGFSPYSLSDIGPVGLGIFYSNSDRSPALDISSSPVNGKYQLSRYEITKCRTKSADGCSRRQHRRRRSSSRATKKTRWAHPRLYTPSTRHPVGKVTSRGGAIYGERQPPPISIDSFRERMPAAMTGRGGYLWSLASPFSAWWGRREAVGALFPTTDLNATPTPVNYVPTPTPTPTDVGRQTEQFFPVVGNRLSALKDVKVGEGQGTPRTRWRKVGLRQFHDWVTGATGLVESRGIVFPSSTMSTPI